MRWRRIRRWLLVAICSGLFCFALSSWYVAGKLIAPANRAIGPAPGDLAAKNISVDSDSGSTIAGWYVSSEGSRATVILLHGFRGDRRQLLSRARLFYNAGYSIVMIDLQAHGESSGTSITLGYLESRDVNAAVKFAREANPNHRIGIVGISLGGAATLLALPQEADAIVLESVYPTITEAVHDRVSAQAGLLSHILTPALLCQLQPRLGIAPSDLRPIDKIASVGCPILIASGDLDKQTTLVETQRLFETANSPKQLTIFQGAAHTDLLDHDPMKYEKEILPFLKTHLSP